MSVLPAQPDAPLILIVDDDTFIRMQLRRVMEQEGYHVVEAVDGQQCLTEYLRLRPDIVLLDAMMPVMDGFACCTKLKTLSDSDHTPVLMITGLEDEESVIQAFEAGAADYVTKPIHWPVLRQRVRRLIHQSQLYRQLEAANEVLRRLAALDGLTQLSNRRRFDEYLSQEWQRMARDQNHLCLILCDIDFFKLFNDTYGHQAGDECLRQIAQAIASSAKRPADLAARYGGEEFAVILPYTDATGGAKVAQTISQQVKVLQIEHGSSPVSRYVTLSLGVASIVPWPGALPETLVASADKALYQAKASGRNTYRVYQAE